jgi:uncharacterized protein
MPEYLHPGVYVEETSFRAKPIEGVSTSTAGLVGRTRKGPEGRPTLVTSFTQFVREFGQPYTVPAGLGDYLGHAVRAFFENGGRRAYIVRALAADALAATSDDPVDPNLLGIGGVLRLPPTSTVIGPTTTLPLDSLRNIDAGVPIEIWSRGTATTPATLLFTRTVADYNPVKNTVTLNTALPTGTVLNPSSTFVLIDNVAPQLGVGHVDGPVAHARSRGGAGNDLAVEIRPRDLAPTRLSTRRYQRDRPIVASLAGTGPGPSATTATLTAADSRALRVGDVIDFATGPNRTITVITNGTLTATAVPAVRSYTAGATVFLRQRAASPAPPADIPVYELEVGDTIDFDGISATAVGGVPHGVAAILRPNDVVFIEQGATNTLLTVQAVAPAAAPIITFTPANGAAEDLSTTTVRLVDTVSTGDLTRLVVGDLQGLTVPYEPFPGPSQQLAIAGAGGVDSTEIQLVDTTTNQLYVTRNPGVGTFPDAVDTPTWTTFELLRVVAAGATTFPVATTAGFYVGAIVEIDDGATKHPAIVTGIDPGNRLLTVDAAPGAIDVPSDPATRRAYVRVLEIDVLVYERDAGGALILKESFPNLTWNHNVGYPRYYVDRINDADNGSKLISFDPPAGPPAVAPDTQPTTDEGFPIFLVNGDDGSALIGVDLIGHDDGPNQRTGIQALGERKDIALVAVPGVTEEIVQQALITHCELLKYRFAILDGRPATPVVTDILGHRNNYDTKYAGYYAPWLTTVDLTTGKTLFVPPSGHVLGICARVDNERGVHKAPANETVRGILDVELPFTDGEQDVLNPVGVNLIREFEGRGIRVWGARTLSSDAEWKYVNVRRLFIFLEHSIDNGTQWVVFEPNNEALWARVKATIESFLFGVWKTGALMGTKPEEAFFVRCDRTTMTQDDIDNGRLVCLIGVAPTYPAEFVIFRIGQFTASSNLA